MLFFGGLVPRRHLSFQLQLVAINSSLVIQNENVSQIKERHSLVCHV